MFEDPQFRAREAIVSVPDAELGSVRMQCVVPRYSGTPCSVRSAGPALGQHNEEIYEELGVTSLDTLEQAARVLGASEWKVFLRVTLPLASRGIVAGTAMAFARAMGEFGATLMIAGNIPGQTQTLSMAIHDAVQAGDDASANVLVVLISVVCVLILLVAGRLLRSRP